MDHPIPIVFAGSHTFAEPSLQTLIDDPDFDVQLVITQPDKPVGRKQLLTPPPVKLMAEKNGIRVEQPNDINNSQFIIHNSQLLIVVAYGQMIGSQLLNDGKLAVNLHPSLLPKLRGATPYQSAILNGDAETGVTIQRMVQKLDAGPILAQKSTKIGARETAESLHDKLAVMGATLLCKTLKSDCKETPQDDSQATYCRKLTRKDGEVDPKKMTAEEIDRRVRALNPWPGVTCEINGHTVKLLETNLKESDASISMPCKGNSILYVSKLLPPGKKPMTAIAWSQGNRS